MTLPPAAPALSVIIPAHNEQARLAPHLGHMLEYLREHYADFELIVVDDGSRDGTSDVVNTALAGERRARLIAYQPNRGKGFAVRTGVLASRGERVLFLDADLSTPVEEIPRALERLESADIVIGSRALPGSDIRVRPPLYRRLASAIFDRVKQWMVGLGRFSDTQCGFKAYRGSIARQLFALARVERFMFDAEVLYLAERAGLRIEEMPVRWTAAQGSKVRFWEGIVHMFWDLARIRLMHRGPIVIRDT